MQIFKSNCLWAVCLFVFFSLGLSSCGEEFEKPDLSKKKKADEDEEVAVDNTANQVDSADVFTASSRGPAKGDNAFATVNNLRVRSNHDLSSNVVCMLKEGESVTFLGETSENEEEIELRGERKVAPFYKVKTKSGKMGWAYGGALAFEKPDIVPYRALVAFIDQSKVTAEDAELISDWSVYSSEALDLARKNDILTVFVDRNFNTVEIKDENNEVIDVVSVYAYTKNNDMGFVCLERGKRPHFIGFQPEVSQLVTEHFKLQIAEQAGEE